MMIVPMVNIAVKKPILLRIGVAVHGHGQTCQYSKHRNRYYTSVQCKIPAEPFVRLNQESFLKQVDKWVRSNGDNARGPTAAIL
jgi:hypothetical protein